MSGFAHGRYEVELRFMFADREPWIHREQAVIAPSLREADHPGCDTVLDPQPDGRPVDDQVNARPSVVRPAARTLFPTPLRNVLVLRTDQLGDVVTSIPALRRLRELLPEARLVGLMTASAAELGQTLGVFDEVIVVDFPDDLLDRRRTMTLPDQEALR